MPIPERKYIVIPHVFNDFRINSTVIFVFESFSPILTSLDQNRAKISDPFASLLGRPRFQIQSSLGCSNSKTKRIELLWNFILSHYE